MLNARMLYVHVPFCRTKCRYCAFYSIGGMDVDAESVYIETVCLEMSRAKERYGADSLTSVFIGGGTPSMLSCLALERLFDGIRRSFDVAPDAEITLEGNPESLADVGKLRTIRQLGVNRLSIGVQSFDDRELATLGRAHNAVQAEKAYLLARSVGFGNVNLDLIWGTPGQDVAGWMRSLSRAVDLHPEHISAYGLTFEEGTPLAGDVAAGRLHVPDDERQTILYETAVRRLAESGYGHYEISNYCLPGYSCRHNEGYWSGRQYVGVGPAAVGTVSGKRTANPRDFDLWRRMVNDGGAPDVERLDAAVLLKEMVMLSLRTSRGLDMEEYRRRKGRAFEAGREVLTEGLCASGLAQLDGMRFRLTDRGMLVSNSIIASLFEGEE